MNKWLSIAAISLCALCIGCNNATTGKKELTPPIAKPDTPVAEEPTYIDSAYLAAIDLADNIATAKEIQILSYRLTSTCGDNNTPECKEWHAPRQFELVDILRKLKPTSMERDYKEHADYTCNIEGKLSIDKVIYNYALNAGGYMTISSISTPDVRLCAVNEVSLSKYFLSMELWNTDADYQ